MKCAGLTQRYKPCKKRPVNGKYCVLHTPIMEAPIVTLIDVMKIPRIAIIVTKYLTIHDDIALHGVNTYLRSVPSTWVRIHDLLFAFDKKVPYQNVQNTANTTDFINTTDYATWCMEKVTYYLNPPLVQMICELYPGISCNIAEQYAGVIAPIFRRIMFRPAKRYIRDVMRTLPPAIYTGGAYVDKGDVDSPRNSDDVYYLHTSIIEDHINDYNKDRVLYHLVMALLRDVKSLDATRM